MIIWLSRKKIVPSLFFLSWLEVGVYFFGQKPSFEIQAILCDPFFKNTQKSAVVKKSRSGKIDFSTSYRPQIIFLMILIDSPGLSGLRNTPNSKSRFFWFLDTLHLLVYLKFRRPKLCRWVGFEWKSKIGSNFCVFDPIFWKSGQKRKS